MNRKCILFIHGLGSNREETWGALEDILNEKKNSIEFSEFNDIDFKFFTYESDKLTKFDALTRKIVEYFLNTDDSKTKLSSQIEKISETLRSYLSKAEFSQYENISIIAHSMGGLISAKYILNALDHHQTPLVNRILYICTPFVGSIFADIAKKLKVNSPETGELTTGYTSIENIISRGCDIDASVKATYLFGDRDTVINECNHLFDYDSQWTIKGDHSTVLDGNHLQHNYEHIENFILNKHYSSFLENLYERAKSNGQLEYEEKFIRKIDSPSAENLFKNHLEIYLHNNPNDANMYKTMMEQINDHNFNPHQPYNGEKYYVEIKSNEAYLDSYWDMILDNDRLNPQFYIGPRGSGKTISQNIWLNKYFKKMEENNIFYFRCDVHKIYHAMGTSVKHGKYQNLRIEDYLDMQFLYIFLKYRDKIFNNKGEHSQGAESQLMKKLYNDIDKSDNEIVKGSKFDTLGHFFDVQSNNIKHNEVHLRSGDRRYSYALELMANIISNDEIETLLNEVNDSSKRHIINNNRLPDPFDKFLGSLNDQSRAKCKDDIIKTINDNKNNSEKILKSDLRTTLYRIEGSIKSTRQRTTELWMAVSRYVQNFAVLNGYKILRMIDGIDNIVIQDTTDDKKFFLDKIAEIGEIKRNTNKKNVYYFISLRNDSFLELENKVKQYESKSISSSDIGFYKYHHENAGDSMMQIISKRFKALEIINHSNNMSTLYGDIVSYIFNKYKHNYFSEENKYRNIRASLRHCMFLSLHSFFEFNRNRIAKFDEKKCKSILDKMFEEVLFLRNKLYVRTEDTTGDKPDFKYKKFPNIFYTHHDDGSQWSGLCRLRIIQLLTNNQFSRNEIIDRLSCLYKPKYLEEKIQNLLEYNLIEADYNDETNNLNYKSTNKASYLLSIVRNNLNVLYFLCLDTPLPEKYVHEDNAFSPESYLSIYIRKIDVSENTGYGNSIVKSITTFVLFINYIHSLEIKKLRKKFTNNYELKKFSNPLNLDDIENKMIGVFKGTISNKEIIKSYFRHVGKYKAHELEKNLIKFGWQDSIEMETVH